MECFRNSFTPLHSTGKSLNFVILKMVDLEGSDDIGDELSIGEDTLQSGFEELADATFEFGGDLLWLVGNVQFRNLILKS